MWARIVLREHYGGIGMKQRIVIEQLKELTPVKQTNLRKLWGMNAFTNGYGDWYLKVSPCFGEEENIWLREKTSAMEPEIPNKVTDLPLLSVGQCIELLNENHDYFYMCSDGEVHIGSLTSYYEDGPDYKGEELIDVLWEAVKPFL